MANIFIGGAWPYANGSLHLGRLASVLPGDIIAKYYRAKGDKVLYVSGSDCYGTPITVQAMTEGVTPEEIANRYHEEFTECFKQLGFSYDLYTRTNQQFHHKVVQQIFMKLLEHENVYKKNVIQTYCETDQQFLPDRYVEGTCPVCGQSARGDQCDFCSTLLDPADLIDKSCKLCGNTPTEKYTEHFYLALYKFQEELKHYIDQSTGWKENARHLSNRYLKEGLQDRAVTRDLSWGVDVPITGFEHKKIYVWIEAVSGYLSASQQWAAETGGSWEDFWSDKKEDIIAYYVHGKDNIPFHTLIWPAILKGVKGLHLPDNIISSEYLTLEGKKFSTSRNWAVWVPDLLKRYNPDSIRYFLIANGPEKRDTNFSWREFILSHNGELLGAFGNFVNRTLVFVERFYDGEVPAGQIDEKWKVCIAELYETVGTLIEQGRLKEALDCIFTSIREANKYYDERKPWIQVKEDKIECDQTLYQCIHIIANLSQLLNPFVPFACEKIRQFLILEPPIWSQINVPPLLKLHKSELLFERIHTDQIEEELKNLYSQLKE